MARGIDSRQLGVGRPSYQPSPFAVRAGYGGQAAALNMRQQLRFDRQTAARTIRDLFEAGQGLRASVAAGVTGGMQAVTAALETPCFTRSVVRNAAGKIVGPAPQYIASSVNKNRAPFTGGTAARVLTYFVMLAGVMKAGALNSPADLVSVVDDVGDTLVQFVKSTLSGDPELTTHYFDGFGLSVFKCDSADPKDKPGETCYAPGGSYYQEAARDPQHARLWGYLDGLSPLEKDLLFWLLVTGGVGGFFYLNRRSLRDLAQGYGLPADEWRDLGTSALKATALVGGALALSLGVSREIAHPVATWLMLIGGAAIMAKEYREPIQQTDAAMPWKQAVLCGSLWVVGEGIYRALADSAGVYQFTPQGHETIYGNWTAWDWMINMPLLAADVATELMLLAPIWARAGGFVQNTVEVAVAATSARLHRNANPGRVRRWLQGTLPVLPSTIEPGTGVTIPPYMGVRSRIQTFTADEKAAVREGRMPAGMFSAGFGHLLTAGGAGALAYLGGDAALSLWNGTSHHGTADVLLSLLGLGAAGVLTDASLRNGSGRLFYRRLASLLGHQFGPNGRGPFWLIYTAVGTMTTAAIGVTSQAIKGFEGKGGYGLNNIAQRSLLNPWVNRIVFGLRTAYQPERPISMFGFFLPGFFSVYCGIEFSAQTTQSLDLQYQAAARDFSLSTDPSLQAELLGEMTGLEAVVREAEANAGYGREETLERVHSALASIASYKLRYGIPELAISGDTEPTIH